MPLTVGSKAPPFDAASTEGQNVSLRSLAGKRFVLYFYPRDNTPGCTQEACDFRDNLARIERAGARVFGVSKDSIRSHEGFRAKHALSFPLLSDPDNAMAKAYGAFGEKKLYGKPVVGVIRSTFLIGPNGTIEAVWSPVRVPGHVDAVIARLRGEEPAIAASAKKGGAKTSAGPARVKRSPAKKKR
jgi:peroxiredoxin Q/BCP